MRVETSKNKEVDKPESRLTKTENSVFNSSNQLKTFDSPPPPANGAFAKILDEARNDGKNNRSEKNAEKSSESNSESTKTEKEITRHTQEKNDYEKERSNEKQNQSGQQNNDENAFPTPFFNPQLNTKINSDISTPPARSILHIADLERIISTIRTEKFQTAQQALITLKNSVLEGLQIKITLAENGTFKAEFLALNKQIKKQIDARKKELHDILRSRSLNFTQIEVFTDEGKS